MTQDVYQGLLENPDDIWSPQVFGALINLTGLYANVPVKCHWNEKLDAWVSKDQEFSVSELGIKKGPGYITFASIDESDVKLWIAGVVSTMSLLRGWATFDCISCEKPVHQPDKNICVFFQNNYVFITN